VLSSLDRYQLVWHPRLVEQRMQTNRMTVRRDVVIFAVDGDYRRQSGAHVINRRELFRQLLGIVHTAEPLTCIILGVRSFEQIRDIPNPKPVNNRRHFQLGDVRSVPAIVAVCHTLAIENILRGQHARDQGKMSTGRRARQHKLRRID